MPEGRLQRTRAAYEPEQPRSMEFGAVLARLREVACVCGAFAGEPHNPNCFQWRSVAREQGYGAGV